MKKIIFIFTALLFVGCTNVKSSFKKVETNNVPLTQVEQKLDITRKYKNVIVFIGDGMGPNHVDAGGIYLGKPLCFDVTNEKWTYHAYSNTDSLTSQGFTLDTSKSLLRPEENTSLYDGTPSPYDSNVSLVSFCIDNG